VESAEWNGYRRQINGSSELERYMERRENRRRLLSGESTTTAADIAATNLQKENNLQVIVSVFTE